MAKFAEADLRIEKARKRVQAAMKELAAAQTELVTAMAAYQGLATEAGAHDWFCNTCGEEVSEGEVFCSPTCAAEYEDDDPRNEDAHASVV